MSTDEVVFVDGYGIYGTTSDLTTLGKYTSYQDVTWANNVGRFGGPGLNFTAGDSYLQGSLPTSPTAVILSFSVYLTNTASLQIMQLGGGGGSEVALIYNSASSQLELINPSGGVLWTSPALSGFLNAWHNLEMFVLLGGVVSGAARGAFFMQIDGNGIGSGIESGINTAPNGSTSYSTFLVGGRISNFAVGSSMQGHMCDLYVRDLSGTLTVTYTDGVTGSTGSITYYGDTRIGTLSPASDATPNNGTPSTGSSHFAVVDSLPYNVSDYITMTNTSGQEELYSFSALGGSPASIFSVQTTLISEKTDAGAASLESVISSSGSTANGASNSLSTGWRMWNDIFMTDPHTGSAWTGSAVNALKSGYKVP